MRSVHRSVCRQRLKLAAVILLAGVAGCGNGLWPVSGRVAFADGSPLDAGIVICEMRDGKKTVLARGSIQPDGTFQLGTEKPGDGAKPGKYRVLVVPRGRTQAEENSLPPIIDRKFEKFETSGIEFEVKAGKNQFPITVTKRRARAGLEARARRGTI
jgi:hypothetical protein